MSPSPVSRSGISQLWTRKEIRFPLLFLIVLFSLFTPFGGPYFKRNAHTDGQVSHLLAQVKLFILLMPPHIAESRISS